MKKFLQTAVIGFIGGITAFLSNVNGCLDFFKRFSSNTSNQETMKDPLLLIQQLASMVLPFLIGYFIYLLLKTKKKQDADDDLIVKTILRLREEMITLKIFNQCLVEETTKYIQHTGSQILTSEKQLALIKDRAKKKMDTVFKHTKTDAEKESLIETVWSIPIEKKL